MVLVAKSTWVSGLQNRRGSGGCKIGVDRRGWFWPWVWVLAMGDRCCWFFWVLRFLFFILFYFSCCDTGHGGGAVVVTGSGGAMLEVEVEGRYIRKRKLGKKKKYILL